MSLFLSRDELRMRKDPLALYVYVMRIKRDDKFLGVKVGFSRDPERRATQLDQQFSVEFSVEVVDAFSTRLYREAERRAHKILGVNGRYSEYFRATPEEAIEAVKQAIREAESTLRDDLRSKDV